MNAAGSSDKLLEDRLKNFPNINIFSDPLYVKVIIYCYNIKSKQINIVSILEIPFIGPDFLVFFRDSIIDNKLQFTSVSYLHTIDLLTSHETRMDISGQDEKERDDHFVRPKDMIVLHIADPLRKGRIISMLFRYLSPDRHSFFEISDKEVVEKSQEMGIFYDPNVVLKTMEELGWHGGVPNSRIVEQITCYKPNSISPDKLYTPEETKIKERLGFTPSIPKVQ